MEEKPRNEGAQERRQFLTGTILKAQLPTSPSKGETGKTVRGHEEPFNDLKIKKEPYTSGNLNQVPRSTKEQHEHAVTKSVTPGKGQTRLKRFYKYTGARERGRKA